MGKQREPMPAGFFWRVVGDTYDKIITEAIKMARRAELRDVGHECGHEFELIVRSRLHISGPDDHTDADWAERLGPPIVVRAHNLRDALLVAAGLPLSDWFDPEEAE